MLIGCKVIPRLPGPSVGQGLPMVTSEYWVVALNKWVRMFRGGKVLPWWPVIKWTKTFLWLSGTRATRGRKILSFLFSDFRG